MSKEILIRSNEILDEIIKNRRCIHQTPELGLDLPITRAFVLEKLAEIGIDNAQMCGQGITCTVGTGKGKTILLRGDMDALAMNEDTGFDFASTNGACHSCGHDAHTSMLLGAAKLLKEQESELNGNVKFMFQPGEEILEGAKNMIAHGILENVDAALALHIMMGEDESHAGYVEYSEGRSTLGGTTVEIKVKGLSAHGSTPEKGIDAITIAAHIIINIKEILARELSCFDNCVIGVGTIKGGSTPNTVAEDVTFTCSVRGATVDGQEFAKNRVQEIAKDTAKMFRGTAETKILRGTYPVVTDVNLSKELAGYVGEMIGPEKISLKPTRCFGEDFSFVSNEVPSAFMLICAGSKSEGYEYSLHHPKMTFDEKSLAVGAAIHAQCAKSYLENN